MGTHGQFHCGNFQVWEHLRSWLHVPLHYSPRMLAADCALHVRCPHCHHCQWHVPSSWSCWELALIQPGSPSGPQEVKARTLAWSLCCSTQSLKFLNHSESHIYIHIYWMDSSSSTWIGLAKASPCLTHIPRRKLAAKRLSAAPPSPSFAGLRSDATRRSKNQQLPVSAWMSALSSPCWSAANPLKPSGRAGVGYCQTAEPAKHVWTKMI